MALATVVQLRLALDPVIDVVVRPVGVPQFGKVVKLAVK
jgi:hypothetical protein